MKSSEANVSHHSIWHHKPSIQRNFFNVARGGVDGEQPAMGFVAHDKHLAVLGGLEKLQFHT